MRNSVFTPEEEQRMQERVLRDMMSPTTAREMVRKYMPQPGILSKQHVADLIKLVHAVKAEVKPHVNAPGSLDRAAYDHYYMHLCDLENVLARALDSIEPLYTEEMGR